MAANTRGRRASILIPLVVLFCMLSARDSFGQTITSSATGSWSVGTTWVGGVVPVSANDVVIATGHTVTLTAAIVRTGRLTVTGTLQLAGFSMTAGDLTSTGTVASSAGTPTLTVGSNNLSGTFSGILGTGAIALTKNGTGSLVLSGLNTYTGTTTVSAGVLRATNNTIVASTSGAFGNHASGLFLNGGTIQSNVATFSRPITVIGTNSGIDAYGVARAISSTITLTVAGTFNLNVGGTFAAGAAGQALTLSGVISSSAGTLSLTKIGTSTATFGSQAVTLQDLTVSAGTLTATSGTLNLAGNFSNSGTFAHNSGTVNLNGTSSQTLGGTAPTFNNLTIANAAGVSLTASIAVNAALTLTSGIVATGANTLTSPAGASVSRTTGHVFGNLQKGIATGAISKTFEVGDATSYAPVVVSFASVTTAGSLTAVTTAGDHANIASSVIVPARSVSRSWALTNGGVGFTTYDVTFSFVAGDVDAGASTGIFIVGRYSAGWTYPALGTRAATSTVATGLAAFGAFQLGEQVGGNISGVVYEDMNYGGGAGRSLAASAGSVRSGARVEVFSAAGSFLTFATTDVSGAYAFGALSQGTYIVRAVNSSVTTSRGVLASTTATQTFRTDASSGAAVAVTDHVGGETPGLLDAIDGSTTLAALTTGTATPQSITSVALSSGNISGVNFGYSFNVIVNKNNSGQGSLRRFLIYANAMSNTGLAQSGMPAGIDNAVFMLADGTARPGLTASYPSQFTSGVATIALASTLPTVSDPVILDATLQPGYTSSPMVELNGAGAGASTSGLTITAGGTSVLGFVINRFTAYGISVLTAGSNTIASNYIGTNSAGTAALANNIGLVVGPGANTNTIGGTNAAARNLISGNTVTGLELNGTTGNLIVGNYMGTNSAGTAAIPNYSVGLYLHTNANNNTIGGIAAGSANVISGNPLFGIAIVTSAGNSILGNHLGTDPLGTSALANGFGVYLATNASGNTIGGTTSAARNIVSGNIYGLYFESGSSGNVVQGNYVGLNAAGTAALANTNIGVSLVTGANNNTIGGTAAGARNVISGNASYGVWIQGANTNANIIQGNYVGTNPAGSAAIANASGVVVDTDASNNIIGGTAAGARNVISGNGFTGILVTGPGTQVQGNYIGTNASGTSAIGNVVLGIWINGGVSSVIGGTTPAARNVISGNGTYGIVAQYASAGLVQGNYIGVNEAGTAALANGGIGVYLLNSTVNFTIGGTGAGAGNVISGNSTHGITLDGAATTGNLVHANYIGINAAGTSPIGNGGSGVTTINGATNNTIGGTTSGAGNLISGNATGVFVETGAGNAILSNSIYGNTGAGIALSATTPTANNGTMNGALGNSDMDHPLFTVTSLNGNQLTLAGYVGSAASQSTFGGASVQVFKSEVDASGFGEGKTLLGTLTADASGNLSSTLTVSGLALGDKITATATDGSNNTSEFGANAVLASHGTSLTGTTAISALPSNATSYTAVFTVQNTGSATDGYDLLITRTPGLTLTTVSMTGAAVTQGANPDSARVAGVTAAGSSAITVTYMVGQVPAATTDTLRFTARSVGNPAMTAEGRLTLTVVRPAVTMSRNVNPPGIQPPGTQLTHTIYITNPGSADAAGVALSDSLGSFADYKLGSAVTNLPAGVTVALEYSNDAGATWTYTPVSAACSAPAGYDGCVDRIRWRLLSGLSSIPPDNTGNVLFIARIR